MGAEWLWNISSSTIGWCLSPCRKLGQFPAPIGVAVLFVPSTPAIKVGTTRVSGPWCSPGACGGRALTRAVLGHGIHAVSQHGLQTVHVPPHGGQVEPAATTRVIGPALCHRRPRDVGRHLRGFALRVQLGGHQALPDEERCHPPGIIVVHGLQELLIVLGPVLALR